MSTPSSYPTSLSDEQWDILQLMLPESTWQPGGPGRPPFDLRRVLDGIFYVNKTGCQWRLMPRDLGNGRPSMGIFVAGASRACGPISWTCFASGNAETRGKATTPRQPVLISQSLKVTTQHQEVGFDGNKRIKGRKRHTLVDTLGLLLAVVVTAANVDDCRGFVTLLESYLTRGGRRLRKIGVDQSYEAQWLKDWAAGLKRSIR